MKKFLKELLKIVLLLIVVAGAGFLYYKNFMNEDGLKILEWENYYNENNIKIFYEDLSNEKSKTGLNKLDETYKIKEQVKDMTNEKEIVQKGVDILRGIADFDDIKETSYNNGYDIIVNMEGRKKLSARDLAIVQRDILSVEGIVSRVGEFRKEDPKNNRNASYYVIEYWSTEENKWIMLDFLDKGYLEKQGVALSAVEVIETKLSSLTYVGDSAQNAYKDNLKKYLSSYTIPIDNSILANKSNTHLTYCTNKKDTTFQIGDRYAPSTIYTKNRLLFERDPSSETTEEDTRAYIVMMKKIVSEDASNDDEFTYVLGAFKNGAILKEYYIQLNDNPVEKVSSYIDITFDNPNTVIKLMEDGENLDSRVEVQRNK